MGKNIFGNFTILYEDNYINKNGKIISRCVCECICGSMRFIRKCDLVSGDKLHCGCLKEDRTKHMIGYVCHRLTVIDYLYSYNGKRKWECQCMCGNITAVNEDMLKGKKQISCGCYRNEMLPRGNDHVNYKNGRVVEPSGYILITINGKYVREHRWLMEQKIGRKLSSNETVHHKDGNRANNDINNLELWSDRHCKGQRVSDLIQYAKDILMQYAPQLLKDNI